MPPTPARAAARQPSDGRSVPKPPKPKVLPVAFVNIPSTMREHARWVLWRLEWDAATSRWTKVPYRADGHGKASSTNRDTWATFDAAREAFELGGRADGVGFVLGDGFVGVDVDGCRDPDTGELTDTARDILATLNTYAEASPSGTGLHAIARGELPAGARRRGGVEMYADGRYFTVTGARL